MSTRIPEMDSWRVEEALGDAYSVANPERPEASLICRNYRWTGTRDTVTVWADTSAQEGGLGWQRLR